MEPEEFRGDLFDLTAQDAPAPRGLVLLDLKTALPEEIHYQVDHHGFAFFKASKRKLSKLIQRLAELRDQFFASDEAYKLKYITNTFGDTGYCERTDLKEQFQVRLGGGIPLPDIWEASEVQDLFARIDRLCRKMIKSVFREQSSAVLALLDPLDRDADYVTSSVITMNHYFNTPTGPDDACPIHADAGVFTICLGPEPGLQMWDPCSSTWVDSNEKSEADMVLMCGEVVNRITNGKQIVTSHRVAKLNVARKSTVFKLRPRVSCVGPRTDADYKLLLAQQKWFDEHPQVLAELTALAQVAPSVDESSSEVERKPAAKKAPKKPLEGTFTWADIPAELLLLIFRELPGESVAKCQQVCPHWNRVGADNQLWKFLAISQFHVIGTGNVDWRNIFRQRLQRERNNEKLMTLPSTLGKGKGPNGMMNVKVITVGSTAVGKTCSYIAWTTNGFPEQYVPTVFDEYSANLMIDGRPWAIGLWDTAGAPDYDRLRPLGYPGSNVCIIMFAVDDRESFLDVERKWMPELQVHLQGVPVVLVACKIDLREEAPATADLSSFVSFEEGLAMSQRVGCLAYFEISGKRMLGISDMFGTVCRLGCLHAAGADLDAIRQLVAEHLGSQLHAPAKKGKCTIQ